MPALAPVCARAGRLPAATARAVANATAREAGLARRTLLGVRQTLICGKVRSLGSEPKLWMGPVAVNTRWCVRAPDNGGKKPGEYGRTGAGRERRADRTPWRN